MKFQTVSSQEEFAYCKKIENLVILIHTTSQILICHEHKYGTITQKLIFNTWEVVKIIARKIAVAQTN